MKRKISTILLCILAGILLVSCSVPKKDKKKELPVLRIGGAIYEPYFYKDAEGGYTGIDVELAREACRRMGYKPVFVEIDLDKRERYLRDGTIDCMWSCFTMDDREKEYQWAGPYLYTRRVIVVRGDSHINSLSDLKGKRVAVQASSTSETIFLNHTNSEIPRVSRLSSFRTIGEVFTALRKGYVDAIAGHEGTLLVYTQDYPGQYRYLNMSIHKSKLGVAFSKQGDARIVKKLKKTLKEMTEDGTTGGMIEKYGLDVDKNVYGGAE